MYSDRIHFTDIYSGLLAVIFVAINQTQSAIKRKHTSISTTEVEDLFFFINVIGTFLRVNFSLTLFQ